MARAIGIPARVAVGFTPGTFDEHAGVFRVSTTTRTRGPRSGSRASGGPTSSTRHRPAHTGSAGGSDSPERAPRPGRRRRPHRRSTTRGRDHAATATVPDDPHDAAAATAPGGRRPASRSARRPTTAAAWQRARGDRVVAGRAARWRVRRRRSRSSWRRRGAAPPGGRRARRPPRVVAARGRRRSTTSATTGSRRRRARRHSRSRSTCPTGRRRRERGRPMRALADAHSAAVLRRAPSPTADEVARRVGPARRARRRARRPGSARSTGAGGASTRRRCASARQPVPAGWSPGERSSVDERLTLGGELAHLGLDVGGDAVDGDEQRELAVTRARRGSGRRRGTPTPASPSVTRRRPARSSPGGDELGDRAADPRQRDAGVEQRPDHPQRDEVTEGVRTVPAASRRTARAGRADDDAVAAQ